MGMGDGHALQSGPVITRNSRRSLFWVRAQQLAPQRGLRCGSCDACGGTWGGQGQRVGRLEGMTPLAMFGDSRRTRGALLVTRVHLMG